MCSTIAALSISILDDCHVKLLNSGRNVKNKHKVVSTVSTLNILHLRF